MWLTQTIITSTSSTEVDLLFFIHELGIPVDELRRWFAGLGIAGISSEPKTRMNKAFLKPVISNPNRLAELGPESAPSPLPAVAVIDPARLNLCRSPSKVKGVLGKDKPPVDLRLRWWFGPDEGAPPPCDEEDGDCDERVSPSPTTISVEADGNRIRWSKPAPVTLGGLATTDVEGDDVLAGEEAEASKNPSSAIGNKGIERFLVEEVEEEEDDEDRDEIA